MTIMVVNYISRLKRAMNMNDDEVNKYFIKNSQRKVLTKLT